MLKVSFGCCIHLVFGFIHCKAMENLGLLKKLVA